MIGNSICGWLDGCALSFDLYMVQFERLSNDRDEDDCIIGCGLGWLVGIGESLLVIGGKDGPGASVGDVDGRRTDG